MDHPSQSLIRLTLAIQRALDPSRSPARLIELPTGSWGRASELIRQARRAELQGWHLATARLQTDLRHALAALQSPLAELEQLLTRCSSLPYRAAPAEIYGDLCSLASEFDALEFNLPSQWVAVTIEPITLEGHYLGPFEIRLDLRRLAAELPYRVIALEPHPAASRAGVTHPHVVDEVLCEGDGRAAIRQALLQGRLLDFFHLVANLLRTYNRESTFVELALWNGEDCSDCGGSVTADESYVCERCAETVCGDCQGACGACERGFCSRCVGQCDHCQQVCCGRCLESCAGCQRDVCPMCLSDQERCPPCHEQEQPAEMPTSAAATGAAVSAHGLGQTAFSA